MLLFPITLYDVSPALIINAGMKGIVNGSFSVFVLMFGLSIPFGKLFCSKYLSSSRTAGICFLVNGKLSKQGWRNYIKYIIWIIWLSAVVFCYFQHGKIKK